MPLNTHSRKSNLTHAATQHWDLIVIGGGITGAGIALEAVARGLSVVLVEQYDFASGTSSKSTKLIHGGLRYLKQLEFGLVRTVGRERAVLHHLAPHLVTPVDMVLPIVEGGSLGKLSTAVALWIYDFLAGVKPEERFKMLTAQQAVQQEPLLRTHNLKGAAVYKEYRTDDARLTMSVLKSAVDLGAQCFNYAQAIQFIEDGGRITGVTIQDLLGQAVYNLKGSVVINAAGPWVDDVRSLETIPRGKRLHLTKGVHIVVPQALFPIKHSIYFDVESDNRMVFAIPRDSIVYIGTTDTNYTGSKAQIDVTDADIQYLLSAVHAVFKDIHINPEDVISGWAGLRPLIHEEGRSPSELSRKDEIFISQKGLISMAGGKLTGYRKMAQKAVDKAIRTAGKHQFTSLKKADTRKINLHGADFEKDIPTYITLRSGEVRHLGITHQQVTALVNRYGTATSIILDEVFKYIQQLQDPTLSLLKAEVLYGIHHEQVTNVSDFLVRRTGRLYFEIDFCKTYYRQIATWIAEELGMDASESDLQLQWFEAVLQSVQFR